MELSRALHRASLATPPPLLRWGKSVYRRPRYRLGLERARSGHARHGHLYRHKWLFIAGLPKSGTSWIESMLGCYPGYALIAHPEVTAFDYRHGGTHLFEMPTDFFSRLGEALCVVKIHCHGSANNAHVLTKADIPYCVLYRDLRDAAVSHVAYVKRTPWHPEYPVYHRSDMRQALHIFAHTLLPQWRDWIESWECHRDRERSLGLRYEEMLADTARCMRKIALLYGLPEGPLEEIIARNSFDSAKRQGSFFRKGQVGDWAEHFDDKLKRTFKAEIGDDLIRWGYESDLDW